MNTIIGLPVWNDRLSTTLDFARRLVIVEADGEREVGRKEVALVDEAVEKKALRMRELAVQVLLCGAISQPLARAIVRAGIRIVPYVTGEIDQVLAAYLCGQLAQPCFLQPGCHPGARRRWQQRCGLCGGRRGCW
jgi:predicted Fe-Mo cluster-binding NifX family protein